MIILGLAGFADVGKDTVADYLVAHYGYTKFAFSDALYQEVQDAFELEDQSLLRDRETKDTPCGEMSLCYCKDENFNQVAAAMLKRSGVEMYDDGHGPDLSPRQILQWWGTEFRREQDPNYWLKKNEEWLAATQLAYPEQRPQHFVNTTCRFPNEQEWIHDGGSIFDGRAPHHMLWTGNVWHIRREGRGPINSHVSDQALPVWAGEGERELLNNDSIERLYKGIDLLMTTNAKFVRVEPMQPDVEPVLTREILNAQIENRELNMDDTG